MKTKIAKLKRCSQDSIEKNIYNVRCLKTFRMSQTDELIIMLLKDLFKKMSSRHEMIVIIAKINGSEAKKTTSCTTKEPFFF